MSYRIHCILIRDVLEYALEERWKEAPVIPITPERALSQQNNPNALQDDPCLWVAEDDMGRVIGFAGSLPARGPDGKGRMGWSSCWWTDPERGREVGLPLFLKFLEAWDFGVAFSDMTSHTYSIVNKLDFCKTREEPLLHLLLRFPLRRLIRRMGPAGWLLSPLILPLALMANLVQDLRLRLSVPARDAEFETRDERDEQMERYMSENSQAEFCPRKAEEYRWITTHPWLVSPEADAEGRALKYPFSYIASDFRYFWLLCRDKGETVAMLHLSVRDGVVKVLSYYGYRADLAMGGLKSFLAGQKGVHSIILAHPELLIEGGSLLGLSLRSARRSRYTGISRKLLDESPEGLYIQMGNGDAIFT